MMSMSDSKGKDKKLGWNFSPKLQKTHVVLMFAFLLLANAFRWYESSESINCQQSQHPIPHHSSSGPLLSVADIKRAMKLPCNYVHDGFYLHGGNDVFNQVYQSLQELNDEDIPIVVECGGHDGITKSLSLKASICLNMNTLLIEASHLNYYVLRQTRAYDMTVNAALCDGDFVEMSENEANSGMTKVMGPSGGNSTNKVRCTTVDDELDKIREMLPAYQQEKIKLIYLVLDVEGHEMVAIKGIRKYPPMKMEMEIKYEPSDDTEVQKLLSEWEASNNLVGVMAGADRRYNWSPQLQKDERKKLFYGARSNHPPVDAATAKVLPFYQYYGE